MDADYWTNQICSPVRFFDAVQAARECGKCRLCRRGGSAIHAAHDGPTVRTAAADPVADIVRRTGFRRHGSCWPSAATLMRDGYSPDLSPLYGRPAGPLHRIPPYVFDTSSRFWFDGRVATAVPTAQPAVVTPVAERQQPCAGAELVEGAVLAVIADVGGYSVAELGRSSRLSDRSGLRLAAAASPFRPAAGGISPS